MKKPVVITKILQEAFIKIFKVKVKFDYFILQPDGMEFDEDKYDFLIHQLDLFKALTYVSIQLTKFRKEVISQIVCCMQKKKNKVMP